MFKVHVEAQVVGSKLTFKFKLKVQSSKHELKVSRHELYVRFYPLQINVGSKLNCCGFKMYRLSL